MTTTSTRRLISTHTLSDGRTLEVFAYKGRDMMNANRMAKGDTMALSFAILASRIQIDGKPQVYEDILDMDGDILEEVMTLAAGDKVENFTSQPRT